MLAASDEFDCFLFLESRCKEAICCASMKMHFGKSIAFDKELLLSTNALAMAPLQHLSGNGWSAFRGQAESR
jgi:hypothetical protein